MEVPEQPFAVAVIVYVAVPEALLLLLESVWAIVVGQDDGQAVAPLIPAVCATVQANVLPETLLVSAIKGAAPEHIVCDVGLAVATGIGFTVTITVIGIPTQPLAVGVIV